MADMRERLLNKAQDVAFLPTPHRGHPDDMIVSGPINLTALVDAILDALREPDEGMQIAGWTCEPFVKMLFFPQRSVAASCFTAMIDHIRSEAE